MVMTRYRHIIWDWNGTLLDDAWLSVEIINAILCRRGLPLLDRERYQHEFDFPVEDYYRRLGLDFTREPFEVLAAEFIGEYDRRWRECRLQRGAREVVQALAARGCAQSVLSAAEHVRLRTMVSAFPALRDAFAHLVGLDHYYATSKVASGLRLLRELPHRAAEVALIGDTTHDFETARAMGIDCFLIPRGHHSREKLARCGAPVVDSVGALLAAM